MNIKKNWKSNNSQNSVTYEKNDFINYRNEAIIILANQIPNIQKYLAELTN